MRADSGLNRLVYEYFEARILYGYYKYGESLPSINKICQMFHLAQATVRAGLALLEKGRICKGRSETSARGGL